MSFGITPLDGSPTPIPMAAVVPDGTTTPATLAGGPSYTDNGNPKAPVSSYIKDGNDVTQGAQADAAYTSGSGSIISLLKGIFTKLAGTLTVSMSNANANGQVAMANSAPVTIASNQTPLVTSTGAKTNVGSSASSVTVLASNASRKKALIYNDSTQILYLDLTGGTASNSSYSAQVAPNAAWLEAEQPIYTGLITGIWAAANGNARVTEWT